MLNIPQDYKTWLKFQNSYTITDDERLAQGVMVLVIIEDSILLVKRSVTMPSHKDQVALIGGHRKEDETFFEETVLREFVEETHLDRAKLKMITALPMVRTSREMGILPVVAYYDGAVEQVRRELKSNGEWDSAFLVKFAYLMDVGNWISARRIGVDARQNLLFCPLALSNIDLLQGSPTFPLMLWGASARVVEHVRNFILTKS